MEHVTHCAYFRNRSYRSPRTSNIASHFAIRRIGEWSREGCAQASVLVPRKLDGGIRPITGSPSVGVESSRIGRVAISTGPSSSRAKCCHRRSFHGNETFLAFVGRATIFRSSCGTAVGRRRNQRTPQGEPCEQRKTGANEVTRYSRGRSRFHVETRGWR